MDQENGAEAPATTPNLLPFSVDEDRHIEMMAEAIRRSHVGATDSFTAIGDEQQAEPLEVKVLYPATRRHILWFFNESRGRVGAGILAIVIIWVLVYLAPQLLFTTKQANDYIGTETLINIGATVLVLFVVFLLEIRTFVLWRTWKLEVTNTSITIGQPGNGFLAIDDDQPVLSRSAGQVVDIKRKWYFALFLLSIYTVSFDSPSQMDDSFKNLMFIKNAKKLKDIFN